MKAEHFLLSEERMKPNLHRLHSDPLRQSAQFAMHETAQAEALLDWVAAVVVPSGHLMQAAAFASEKLPMLQSVQNAAFANE